MKYLEDIEIGATWRLGSRVFIAEDIKRFAARFDPQPFHLDEAAAARSHFGALCASGWQTAAIWMRLLVEYMRREGEAALARGETVARVGPSPGLRDLKWLKPVYAGDTITYSVEVTGTRPSETRPDYGLLTMQARGVNQDGLAVITFISTVYVERRPR